ncbi:hypothetical protein [Mucilaginibacter pedocola]|uniref:hypothetical protein n=1 Tax=Mucilaginibacter pedocola TaxID=1792845 RepID=UPI0012DCC31A|nr:hypothetical protein [Mucilaginibacter pedocola]
MLNHLSLILAYIDPGSGSLIYQVILSAVLTLSVFWKNIKLYVSAILNRSKTPKEDEE